MPDTTTPSGIVYPVPTDPIAPLNAVFQDLAESAQSAIITRIESSAKIDDYTLALSDAGLVIAMNKTGPATLTIPENSSVAFPIGTIVWVYNLSAQAVTIQGDGGVTLRNAAAIAQFGEIRLRKRATNEWVAEPTEAALNAFQSQIDAAVDSLSELEETSEKNDDHTLELADKGKVVLMNKSTAATLTVPSNASVNFPIGSLVYVYNAASNNVTVAGAGGVTVRNAGTVAQFKQVTLRKRAADEWVLI